MPLLTTLVQQPSTPPAGPLAAGWALLSPRRRRDRLERRRRPDWLGGAADGRDDEVDEDDGFAEDARGREGRRPRR